MVIVPRSLALSNIIGNAPRYGKQARVAVRRNNRVIEVMIDDDGPGIPASERQAVFTAFHRAESSRSRSTGGTGLGLAIALGIVERQHGGSIEITDAPGGGARLKITVPSADGRGDPRYVGKNAFNQGSFGYRA